ncbi:alkaline phosphatase [Pseudomonas aeruginosa]
MTPGYPLALSLAVLHGRARRSAFAGPGAPGRSVAVQPPGLWRTQRVRRRTAVEQDLTQALKQSLSKKKAKNVILLIGDGMGDSEITVARNYARGAGGYFKGIDAVPLTGQYTHYSCTRTAACRTT